MKFVKHLLFAILTLASTQVYAQYEHIFTNYNMAPVMLNPALTGAYEGSYRVGALYRDQWDVGSRGLYTSVHAFADLPAIMIKKRHWLGFGLGIYNDVAGKSALTLTQRAITLSGAFHYALDKNYKNVFTVGLQVGGDSYGFDLGTDPLTYSEISGAGGSQWRSNLNGLNGTKVKTQFGDVNLGVMLKSKIDKKSDLTIGLTGRHINSPKYGLVKSGNVKLPTAFTVHAEYNRMLNKKLSLSPNILYRKIGTSTDVSIQGVLGYKMTAKGKDVLLRGGVGVRQLGNNAINFLAGADFKNYKLMVGYDLPTGTPATSSLINNTLEVAFHYTGKNYKKPPMQKIHFCPKY